jgi:hypothetical protein
MTNVFIQKFQRNARSRRRGAITALFAILLPIILVIAGFGLYVAWSQLVRTELRTATDFAARAGAKRLSMDQSQAAGTAAAIDSASRNTVGGAPLVLAAGDIDFGISQQNNGVAGRFSFQPGGNRVNGVRVRAGFQGNDATTSFLANIAGLNSPEFNHDATATNLDRDICVVIDRSGSMTSPVNSTFNGTSQPCGPLPSTCRFAALAIAVDAFIDELNRTPQQELVCLASYSSNISYRCDDRIIRYRESEIHSSLTTNPNALRAPIQGMLRQGVNGATAIGSGLRSGIQAVQGTGARPFASPTIVLMTDGNHNLGTNPTVVAQQAAALDIVVHTITFSRGADQRLMQQVAGITGGKHFHADSLGDLSEAFREVARTLPVLLTE